MGLFGRRYFDNGDQAKNFLIEKICLEASIQGKALNENERKALNYAADEPSTEREIDWDRVRNADEFAEHEENMFEREMTALLKSAYERDRDSGSDTSPNTERHSKFSPMRPTGSAPSHKKHLNQSTRRRSSESPLTHK